MTDRQSNAETDDAPASGLRKLASSVIPAFALLAFAVLAGLAAGWIGWRNSAQVERNNRFTLRLERLLSELKDLETGQRGFLLTGDPAYLEPYDSANAVIDSQLEGIASLGFPLGDLRSLVAQRRASAAAGIEAYRASGAATAVPLVKRGRGKALMDLIRDFVQQREAEADQQIADLRRNNRHSAYPLSGAAVLALALAFTLLLRAIRRRRRAQQASAALLEGVLDNAPVGLGFLDATLRFRQINRSLRAMSERALSAAIGHSLWEVLPTMRDALEARIEAVVSGGRTVHNIEVAAESVAQPGQMRNYQVSVYPLRRVEARSDALVDGAGIVVTDVTARKRSEQHLRESEERFRTLTKSVASIVWMTDGRGTFDRPQSEWALFTGQDFDQHRGDGWMAAVHPDDRAMVAATWTAALAERTPYRLEHRLMRADGAWRHVAAHAVPILDGAGAIREWVGSHTDITERKQAELELAAAKDAAESANRAKSMFLANMSHELRTPLSAVIGYSEMMEEEVEDLGVDSLKGDLGKIRANARHLLSLINDVLDLSKIEANRMDVSAEEVGVATLLEDVVSTVDALVQKKNNTLTLDADAALGTMTTDGVKLRQCLFNLISNAAKFTEGGEIRLAAERERRADGDWLQFRIIDTGIGMTAEQLERLFQRFSQADETTTRKYGGTGLGLAITRAFCRLLGGDIRVESFEGQGSTFVMDLPAIMPVAGDGAPTEPTVPEQRRHEDSAVVLVIDDDAAQRDIMARFLDRQGFVARTAPDGETGLEMARTLKPRAILLDVMMPRMDGWSVLTALKGDPELAKIPVVMVTFVHDTGMGAALGAADYLTKPVHWDKLKTVMDRFRDQEGDVLIVDDDADARARLKAALERNGWTTVEAANGQEALDRVAEGVPRVILLDLTMPVMDGFSFLEQLRDRPGGAEIPVVVLTARDLSSLERRRLESAERVFSKGVASLSDITRELRALAPPDGRHAEAVEQSPG